MKTQNMNKKLKTKCFKKTIQLFLICLQIEDVHSFADYYYDFFQLTQHCRNLFYSTKKNRIEYIFVATCNWHGVFQEIISVFGPDFCRVVSNFFIFTIFEGGTFLYKNLFLQENSNKKLLHMGLILNRLVGRSIYTSMVIYAGQVESTNKENNFERTFKSYLLSFISRNFGLTWLSM